MPVRHQFSISIQVVLALLLGASVVLCLAEYSAFLEPVGRVCIFLLQMIVLAYIVLSAW
jgi:Na+/H+-dicarboxylate symporter